jgi:hypothetical protein
MDFDRKPISVARNEPTPGIAARPILKDGAYCVEEAAAGAQAEGGLIHEG